MSTRCPYLGLLESRAQVVFVAHPHHRCYLAREPERIGSSYQLTTCLCSGYRRCPRLATRAPAVTIKPTPAPSVPLPAARATGARYTDLRPARRARRGQIASFELLIAALTLSMVIAALALGYAVYYRQQVGPGMDVGLAVLEAVPPQPTLVATYTATATAVATAAPTAPPATPVPALPTTVFTSLPALPTAVFTPLPATATVAPRPPAIAPPTRLVIAKINLDIPVKSVGPKQVRQGNTTRIVWGDVANAGAFHNTSAYPGNAGNTVINGHRDIAGSVFRHLDRVEVGDEIVVYVGDAAYRYQVSEILIVPETYASAAQRAQNRALIGPHAEERLTLVTCTPVGLATHRLVVIARPPQLAAPDMPAAGDGP